MSLIDQQKGMTDLLPCNAGCGGDYASYSFTQGDKDVTVCVPLPEGSTSKSVLVDIRSNYLKIVLKTHNKVILEGALFKPIKASESTWYIEEKKQLFVNLVKTNLKYEEWWPHVVEGERQIDMKTLKPPAANLYDLDEGAQATVAKMMYEQQQQRRSDGPSERITSNQYT